MERIMQPGIALQLFQRNFSRGDEFDKLQQIFFEVTNIMGRYKLCLNASLR